jgi:endo-1,4-beta-xylanase
VAAHSGTSSLLIENRSSAWHGPSLRIEQYLNQGEEYIISAWVKLISPASTQLQLSTQVGEGNAASYHNLVGKTIGTADGWVEFTGTYRYTNTSSGYITIYIESASDATASFAIDDVIVQEIRVAPIVIEDLTPLKSRYENHFLIGNVVSGADLAGVRFELLSKHFSVLTAENAMKPSSLQHDKGIFTFDDADAIVNAVLAAGIKMHGHTLAWHQQSSEWMNYAGIPRDEALTNLVTHIKTVAEHFKGRVISWDVLNEAIVDNPPNPADWKAALRQSPWYLALGPDYVEIAFKAAREADPNAKLYYNDYNLDNPNKALAVYNMVRDINTRNPNVGGRPLIDGVGMQGHYRVNTNPTNVTRSLDRFISLDVEVSITELDVQAGADSKLTAQQAIEQGIALANLFTIFRVHAESIGRVTIWGLDDGSSWRSSTNPTLFDKNLKAKPAFYGASNPFAFLAENEAFLPKETRKATALYATPVIDGQVDSVWDAAQALPINQNLMAWQGATGTAKVLWDDAALYVLIQVPGAELNKASPNTYEQDSIEVFVDENNNKSSFYESDDGQFRVNFDNETSFNPASIASGFVSATSISGKSYTVEVKIPLRTIKPANGTQLGFDVQINGASSSGVRQNVTIWNDISSNSFQDTSGFGLLTLTGK